MRRQEKRADYLMHRYNSYLILDVKLAWWRHRSPTCWLWLTNITTYTLFPSDAHSLPSHSLSLTFPLTQTLICDAATVINPVTDLHQPIQRHIHLFTQPFTRYPSTHTQRFHSHSHTQQDERSLAREWWSTATTYY